MAGFPDLTNHGLSVAIVLETISYLHPAPQIAKGSVLVSRGMHSDDSGKSISRIVYHDRPLPNIDAGNHPIRLGIGGRTSAH
jgi:hypothetical protein